MPTKNPTKEQQARWNRAWYEGNKEKRLAITRERRRIMQLFLHEYKKQRPCPCGESHVSCLQFHHALGKDEQYDRMLDWSKERVLKELEKCVVLCANCHMKTHWSEKVI